MSGYQTEDGGFSYWSRRGVADAAVTAYALQFLKEAGQFVDIDEGISTRARLWLHEHQISDGSWQSNPGLTAYVANNLSVFGMDQKDGDVCRNTTLGRLSKCLRFATDFIVK